ncbi:MAG: PilZ domain-containing protein [Proteobacteria bacterium]|nr:PilZ domain-containing protein [Pseudomonadota bacterium]NQW44973.1 PilZ domain-containing protein [Deltaproteobacteria bacterium]
MDKRKSKDKSDKGIIDLEHYRKEKTEERRREYERVLFNRILGVYSFAEKTGLHHVEILDMSYSGLRFREDNPEMPLRSGQKIALRFYFTPSSFLRVVVDVKRVTPFEAEQRQGLEYGCEIDTSTKSSEVLKELVDFMYKYAETACHDDNPPMIWF